jgi:hypothetical protein
MSAMEKDEATNIVSAYRAFTTAAQNLQPLLSSANSKTPNIIREQCQNFVRPRRRALTLAFSFEDPLEQHRFIGWLEDF